MSAEEIIRELHEKFPLITNLKFKRGNQGEADCLPLLIALTSAITNPDIHGDHVILVPVKHRIAAYTSILSAFTGVIQHFPDLLNQYVRNGFRRGERVKVLPTGHVYEYDGTFDIGSNNFFRLKVYDAKDGSTRSFPINEAVRLEKTNASLPKGKLNSNLGKYIRSPLDNVLNIDSSGNNALLNNETMLITSQKEFIDFMDNVIVCCKDSNGNEIEYTLDDIVPWGIVNHEGDIDFKGGSVATGEPIIGVSPRLEYVATACRKTCRRYPRVIIDGANRVKDLQAFDDVVENSKLLVIAEHSETDNLHYLEERGCKIWCLPEGQEHIFFTNTKSILPECRTAYQSFSNRKIKIINCDSAIANRITSHLKEAEKVLLEEDSDESLTKITGFAYARLLTLSSMISPPAPNEYNTIKIQLSDDIKYLARDRKSVV